MAAPPECQKRKGLKQLALVISVEAAIRQCMRRKQKAGGKEKSRPPALKLP
jgi:hypothetical protein